MEKQYKIKKSFFKLIHILLISCLFVACNDDIDNEKSRNQYNLELTASADNIILNENNPYETALNLEWTPSTDMGDDYKITYTYEISVVGSKLNPVKEYEDAGVFNRSYTHKELQDMLIDYWEQLTSTTASMQFTITASYEGPRVVIPEISIVTVKVKTYGPKQFLADKIFMTGTAIGGNEIEVPKKDGSAQLFVWTGDLSAGTIKFPVIYGNEDRENAICPVTAGQEITDDAMDAKVETVSEAGTWTIKDADKYRVTINLATKTVTIIPAGDVFEADKIYIAGSAVDEEIELTQTLEDESCYAFRGELKAGSLYLPILFENKKALSIVPNASGSQNINDGNTVNFAQTETESAASTNYWNIQSAGTYRIVVNTDTKMITIYSAATDLQPKEVSWNNTVEGINPYKSKVEQLWMYGGFNAYAGDGNGFTGFNNKYILTQSKANPYIFVYKGDALPRETITDEYDKQSYTGVIRFAVSNIHNNVYAYGSTADAERNKKNGYTPVTSSTPQKLVEGQAHNRYAYFLIPENTNYVMVDIQNLTVVFDHK
ncbi:MAG: SusE domain-containing protein [Dysgonomonas sp.]|nr:SusE domain-containing protein [Dysgonomonas sp.]